MDNNQRYGYPSEQNVWFRRGIVIIAVAVVVIFALAWIARQSYIEVSVPNAGKDGINFVLTSSAKNQSGSFSSGKTKKKLSAPKGNYELLITQGETSYYVAVKTSGIFKTTAVNAALTIENNRTFIGDNPEKCLNLVSGLLVSGGCGGLYANLAVHQAATSNEPTYKLTDKAVASSLESTTVVDETVEGIVTTAEGSFVLMQLPEVGEETIASHSIYSFNPNESRDRVKLVRDLPNANVSNPYQIQFYKQGFITYDSTINDVTYHSKAAADPEAIILEGPKTKDLAPVELSSLNEQILTLYSNADSAAIKKLPFISEVILGVKNSSVHFTFKKNYSSAQLCGSAKLCLLGDATIDVYDISKKKSDYLYSVANVQTFRSAGKNIFAVNKSGVLKIDVDNKSGYQALSLGKNTFNDFNISNSGFVISLTDNKGKRFALHITNEPDKTGAIDKKVTDLKDKIGDVSAISAYGDFIFVTPNLGDLVYDPSTGFFGYNPETRKAMATKVDQAKVSVGINLSKYKVINTTQ